MSLLPPAVFRFFGTYIDPQAFPHTGSGTIRLNSSRRIEWYRFRLKILPPVRYTTAISTFNFIFWDRPKMSTHSKCLDLKIALLGQDKLAIFLNGEILCKTQKNITFILNEGDILSVVIL